MKASKIQIHLLSYRFHLKTFLLETKKNSLFLKLLTIFEHLCSNPLASTLPFSNDRNDPSRMDPFVSSGTRDPLAKMSGGQGEPRSVQGWNRAVGQNWIPGQATRISVNALALSSFIRLINWRAGVGGGEEDTAGFYDTREFTANFQQYSQLGLNGLAQIVTAPIINRSPPFNARNSPRISNNISADGRRVSFDPRTNSLVLVRRAKEMDK